MPDNFWNSGAASRYFDLDGELKVELLHPSIVEEVTPCSGKKVLDFGCGEGGIARRLAERGAEVVAFDRSRTAVEAARVKPHRNVKFLHSSPPDYLGVQEEGPYDLVVMSLVLCTIQRRDEALAAFQLIHDNTRPGARFIFADTHPCFHGATYSTFSLGYSGDYPSEGNSFPVEVHDGVDFGKRVTFTDFHRPLDVVFDFITSNGFLVRAFRELYEPPEIYNNCSEARERRNAGQPCFILIDAMRGA